MASSQWRQRRIFKTSEHNSLQALKNMFKLKLRTDKEFVKQAVCEKTDGLTPLIIACRRGYLKVVRYLVTECGADVHQVADWSAFYHDMQCASPLLCAIMAGHQQIVKFLILAGADVNSTSHATWTPLKAATHLGYPGIVQVLLDEGADIEVALLHGPRCAVTNWTWSHERIRLILDNIARTSKPPDSLTVHMYTIFSMENMTLLDYFSLGSAIIGTIHQMILDYEREGRPSDFQIIIRYIGLFLEYCVSEAEKEKPNHPSQFGAPKMLLDYVLYLNDKTPIDPQSLADYEQHYYMIVALEQKWKREHTILHSVFTTVSMKDQNFKAIHFLVEMGADVNSQDMLGNTPLHLAATFKPFNPELVDALLQHNAHIDLVNADNKTAMDLLPAHMASVCGLSQPVRYQTLQCLAARAVCKYNVPYRHHGEVTEQCIEIIEQHKWTAPRRQTKQE